MCHPAIVAAVSLAGSLAGSALQAAGHQERSRAQAEAEERRAEFAERQIKINRQQASFERKRLLERRQGIAGHNRAMVAERGLLPSGSPADVQVFNDFEAAHTIEAIRYRAESQGDNLAFEARSARHRARIHRQAGRLNAATSLLGGLVGGVTRLGGSFQT